MLYKSVGRNVQTAPLFDVSVARDDNGQKATKDRSPSYILLFASLPKEEVEQKLYPHENFVRMHSTIFIERRETR